MNDRPAASEKKFSFVSDDPRVEVVIAADTGTETYSFLRARIDHLESRGAAQSRIVLQNGRSFIINLTLPELTEKIDRIDSVVDLKEFCVASAAGPVMNEREMPAAAAHTPTEAGGVFMGQFKIRCAHGLSKLFNVYAAPEDLRGPAGNKDTFRYEGAVKQVIELKNWYGFDGEYCATETDLYASLRDGSYKGGWIIPPQPLMTGNSYQQVADLIPTDESGDSLQKRNMYALQNLGGLKGTFSASRYWTCTRNGGSPQYVQTCSPLDASENWETSGSNTYLPCRLIRFAPVTKTGV